MSKPNSETKQKLLICAAEIFMERGYKETTIRMIADRANVNSALISYHFSDKETLYLQVVRYWAADAFATFPLDHLDDPAADPEKKVYSFIYHTLLCLFGPEGSGTGFGRLLAHEALGSPSDMVHMIVSETIGRPTRALTQAIRQITGIDDAELLRNYTACIVGQTVYFYLSRNLTNELLGGPLLQSEMDIRKLSNDIHTFSMAALENLVFRRQA